MSDYYKRLDAIIQKYDHDMTDEERRDLRSELDAERLHIWNTAPTSAVAAGAYRRIVNYLRNLTKFEATVVAIEASDASDQVGLVLRIPPGSTLKAGDVVVGMLY